MIAKAYTYRFELFLTTQLCILFGSLVFPLFIFESILLPVLFMFNICTGILLISQHRKWMWFLIVLFIVSILIFGSDMLIHTQNENTFLLRLFIYFLFHCVVTFYIIYQIWKAEVVNRNVIIGLISGYISIGFLAFFLFMAIELTNDNAFRGLLLDDTDYQSRIDSLMYYSFITLMTIGYGEIVPVIPIAQKASVLVGLVGQFYIIIISSVIISKYLDHSKMKRD
ncbi:MAG: ion channel [Bacteroidota bacterium]